MVWDFIQNQLLGMRWLNDLVGQGLAGLGLDIFTRLGGSVQFFIYDVIKIVVLLCLLIFLISYVQSYFPPERSRKIMGRFKGIWANIAAALLGTVTPFCSCSSIPLFMGFTSAGLPLGVTFSFLISSPMVDLGSLVLLMSIFGPQVALLYVLFGLVIAVIGGTLIQAMRMEPHVEDFVLQAAAVDISAPDLSIRDRLRYAKEQTISTFKKVFPYILLGVGIGAVIHVHSPWATTLACLEQVQREGVPAFHYMIAVAGGDSIPCAPYEPFGSARLSAATLAVMRDRRACLLANHGMLAAGPTLRASLELALHVEWLCRVYAQALNCGAPVLLDAARMQDALARFGRYRPDPG